MEALSFVLSLKEPHRKSERREHLRDAIDAIQALRFEGSDDIHTLSILYESLLAKRTGRRFRRGVLHTPAHYRICGPNGRPEARPDIDDPPWVPPASSSKRQAHACGLGHAHTTCRRTQTPLETFFGQEKTASYSLGCMTMILNGVLTPP